MTQPSLKPRDLLWYKYSQQLSPSRPDYLRFQNVDLSDCRKIHSKLRDKITAAIFLSIPNILFYKLSLKKILKRTIIKNGKYQSII